MNVQPYIFALALGAAIGLSSGLTVGAQAQQGTQQGSGAQLAGAPVADWRGGAVSDPNGRFLYCVAENRFDNNLGLGIARNPVGETSILIGIPGAGMDKDAKFPLNIRIDESITRNVTGVAVGPDMMALMVGKDEELYEGMRRGNRLIMQGPTDTAIFQLRGTSKALADLRTCVQQEVAGAGGTAKPGGAPNQKAAEFPETLRALLNAAGLREAVPLSLAGVPQDRRPADFAWRIGPVFGGVREARTPPDANFETLTTSYLDMLKQPCGGEFTAKPDAIETLPRVSMRTAMVTCKLPDNKINVALLFYTSPGDIFTVFFHEASDKDLDVALKARDGLTQVVRRLGAEQPQATAPQGQPAPNPN